MYVASKLFYEFFRYVFLILYANEALFILRRYEIKVNKVSTLSKTSGFYFYRSVLYVIHKILGISMHR